ncbi:hypothetical protein A5824_001919, partial [Enterococcus faecalis]
MVQRMVLESCCLEWYQNVNGFKQDFAEVLES